MGAETVAEQLKVVLVQAGVVPDIIAPAGGSDGGVQPEKVAVTPTSSIPIPCELEPVVFRFHLK